MVRCLALSTVLVLGLLAVTVPPAQVADDAPNVSAVSAIPGWMLNFFRLLQGRNGPVSTSMEPREITLVGRTGFTVRLRVPEAYIDRAGKVELAESGASGTGGFVDIVAFLPDMLPKHLAEQAGHKIHGPGIGGVFLGSEDRVGIVVYPPLPVSWASQVERAKKNYIYDRDADGFVVYYQRLPYSPDGNPPRFKDVLIPLGSEDAIIECSLGKVGQRLGCSVSVPQEAPMRIEIHLWNTHLSEWREIVSKARALVNSFIEAHWRTGTKALNSE